MAPYLPRVPIYPILGEKHFLTVGPGLLEIPATIKDSSPLIGQPAPEINLPDHLGRRCSLHATIALGRPIIVFFFPLAGSPHCTKESCLFRDAIGLTPVFSDLQAIVIGISQDPPERSKKFVDEHHLGYRILHDEHREAMETYGVKRTMMGLVDQRCTFIIDPSGLVRGMAQGVLDSSGHLRFAEKWLIRLEHELSQRSRQLVEYSSGAGDLAAGVNEDGHAMQVVYGDAGSARGGGIGGAPRYGAVSAAMPATMLPQPIKAPRMKRSESLGETEHGQPGLEKGWRNWKAILANLSSPDNLPPPAVVSSAASTGKLSSTYSRKQKDTRLSPNLESEEAEGRASSSSSIYSKRSTKSNPAKSFSKRSRSLARDGLKRFNRSQTQTQIIDGEAEEVPPVPPLFANVDTGEAKYEDGEDQDSSTFRTGSSSKTSSGSTAPTSNGHGGSVGSAKAAPMDLGNGWSKTPITSEVMMVTNEGFSSSARTPRGAIASIAGGAPVMRKPVPGGGSGSLPPRHRLGTPPRSSESARSFEGARGRRRPVPEIGPSEEASSIPQGQDEEFVTQSENGALEFRPNPRPKSRSSNSDTSSVATVEAVTARRKANGLGPHTATTPPSSRPSSASSRKLAPALRHPSDTHYSSPLSESVRFSQDEARESLILSPDATMSSQPSTSGRDTPTVPKRISSQDTSREMPGATSIEHGRRSSESSRSEIMPSPVQGTVELPSTTARRANGNGLGSNFPLKPSPAAKHRRNTSVSSSTFKKTNASSSSPKLSTSTSSSRAQTPTMTKTATVTGLGLEETSPALAAVAAAQIAQSRRQSSEEDHTGILKARSTLPRKPPPPMHAPPPPPPPPKDDIGSSPALLNSLSTSNLISTNHRSESSNASSVTSTEGSNTGSPTGYSDSSRRPSLAGSIQSNGTFG